ncbi:hypothetical protein VTO42DRAFT_212 [Malbranchea cinnamomea]
MWANRFVKRLSGYKRIKQHPMEPKKIQAEDIGIVQSWYDGLEAFIKSHHISPQNIFQQYQHWHGKAVNEAARLGDEMFDHREFLTALPGIRDQTFTSRTIRAGWASRGIWPIKPAVVIEELEEICVDDGPEIEMIDELPESSPPPSVPSSQLSSPKTITRLRTSIQKAKTALEDIEMVIEQASPTLNSRLQKIFRGSLLQAELNAQREEDLNRYLQASQRRKRKTTRRQAGGPLYVMVANRKVEERKVEETKKARERRRRQQIRDGKKKVASTTGNGDGSEMIEEIARGGPENLGSLPYFIDTQGAWPN